MWPSFEPVLVAIIGSRSPRLNHYTTDYGCFKALSTMVLIARTVWNGILCHKSLEFYLFSNYDNRNSTPENLARYREQESVFKNVPCKMSAILSLTLDGLMSPDRHIMVVSPLPFHNSARPTKPSHHLNQYCHNIISSVSNGEQ